MSLWVSRQGLGEWSRARASALADGLGGQSGNTEFRENTSDQRAGARARRGGAPCGPRPGERGAGRPRALGVARASRACCLGPRCGASLTCPPHGHRAPRPGTASLTSQRQKRPRHAPRSPARARGARRPASASGPWPPSPRGVPARAPGPARTFRHGELAGRRLSGPRRDGVRPEPLHRPVLGRLLLRLRSLRAAGVQHRLQDPPPGVDEPGRGADRGAAVTSSRSSGRPQERRAPAPAAASQHEKRGDADSVQTPGAVASIPSTGPEKQGLLASQGST